MKTEGQTKLPDVDATTVFTNYDFDVTVSDGKMSIEFSDGGGSNPHWVANRIKITPNTSSSKSLNRKALDAEDVEDENSIDGTFRFYPNPSGDLFNIEIPRSINLKEKPSLVFYDVIGNVVISQLLTNYNVQVTLGNLSSGVYMVVLSTSNKVIRTRLVKK